MPRFPTLPLPLDPVDQRAYLKALAYLHGEIARFLNGNLEASNMVSDPFAGTYGNLTTNEEVNAFWKFLKRFAVNGPTDVAITAAELLIEEDDPYLNMTGGGSLTLISVTGQRQGDLILFRWDSATTVSNSADIQLLGGVNTIYDAGAHSLWICYDGTSWREVWRLGTDWPSLFLRGQLNWKDGLGVFAHLRGPNDQTLLLQTGTGKVAAFLEGSSLIALAQVSGQDFRARNDGSSVWYDGKLKAWVSRDFGLLVASDRPIGFGKDDNLTGTDRDTGIERAAEGITKFTNAQGGVGGYATPQETFSIGADQNDYNPGSGSFWRMSATGAPRSVTGIAGGVDGRRLSIVNLGTNAIYFTDEDTNSASANRIASVSGTDLSINQNEMAHGIYDNQTQRWRMWTTKT